MKKPLLITALSMIFMAALSRLIPHAPNFTAVTAMALFAGATLPHRWLAVLIPVTALFLSDLLLGLHKEMLFIYIPFAIIALASSFAKSQEKSWMNRPFFLGFSSLAASLFFFTVSNFGVWLVSGMYVRSAEGLVTCYMMALPFLVNQIVGDLFFSALLFTAWSFALSFAKSSVADSSRAL